jgi:hypothetical protein
MLKVFRGPTKCQGPIPGTCAAKAESMQPQLGPQGQATTKWRRLVGGPMRERE